LRPDRCTRTGPFRADQFRKRARGANDPRFQIDPPIRPAVVGIDMGSLDLRAAGLRIAATS
jgi:hypothetical protein